MATSLNIDIYPRLPAPKARVDIGVPLRSGTSGAHYLSSLRAVLSQLDSGYRIAFVIAGTDVLATDPLGGFKLTVDECVTRDKIVVERLHALSIPTVVLGGGGYSKESAKAVSTSIAELYKVN